MRFCPSLPRHLCALLLLASAHANSLEESIALKLIDRYNENEARLEAIGKELEALPTPYLREPTGTGGGLSNEKDSASSTVSVRFRWKDPVELDAVALFPLRLYMDEIYGEHLYWPGFISIEAMVDGETKVITQQNTAQPLVRQSLPQFIEFRPVTTQELVIHCTDLPQHPYEKWHAAGFAEICVFSGADNVAPKAETQLNGSRQGYFVLAKEFLTDLQTPLGLPHISDHSKTNLFLKRSTRKKATLINPYVLTFEYPDGIPIDSVRIDPAVEHSYGQSFPSRFIVEVLDKEGDVISLTYKYKDFPYPSPGLNPYWGYFGTPQPEAYGLRLTVFEVAHPHSKAVGTIALSEITPFYKGVPQARAPIINEEFRGKLLSIQEGENLNSPNKRMLASINDGQTQFGRILPLRDWVEGLAKRQQLLDEQVTLQNEQAGTLNRVSQLLTYGSVSLLIVVVGFATFFTTRNRIRMRKELRLARAKIASDLHDDVGSNLGAIILQVEKLKEQPMAPMEQKRLKTILSLTRESTFGLREVLSTTAPEVAHMQNIVTYMHELAELLSAKNVVNFTADPNMDEALLDHRLRKGLLLFYKEALYNAKRHADCSQIDITLRMKDKTIVLKIKDNGLGIAPDVLNKPRTLRTLKQRAEWLDAKFDVESSLGHGTEVTLTVPQVSQSGTRRL